MLDFADCEKKISLKPLQSTLKQIFALLSLLPTLSSCTDDSEKSTTDNSEKSTSDGNNQKNDGNKEKGDASGDAKPFSSPQPTASHSGDSTPSTPLGAAAHIAGKAIDQASEHAKINRVLPQQTQVELLDIQQQHAGTFLQASGETLIGVKDDPKLAPSAAKTVEAAVAAMEQSGQNIQDKLDETVPTPTPEDQPGSDAQPDQSGIMSDFTPTKTIPFID